jgi:hypothetical protein
MEHEARAQQGMAAACPRQAAKRGGEAPPVALGQPLPGGIVEDLAAAPVEDADRPPLGQAALAPSAGSQAPDIRQLTWA